MTSAPNHRHAPKMTLLRSHSSYAQAHANGTKEAVDLYDDAGVPRLVLKGWPCSGVKLNTYGVQFPEVPK